MVQNREVEGFAGFEAAYTELKDSDKDVFMLFSGSVDPATGRNWCPDCEAADPVIEKALSSAPEDAVFVHVHVGPRDFWKNPQCVFRTDSRLRLKGVPTLIKLGTAERLVEEQLTNASLVEMMFAE